MRIGDGNHNELKVEDDRVERRVVVEPGASKQLAVNLQPASWIFLVPGSHCGSTSDVSVSEQEPRTWAQRPG